MGHPKGVSQKNGHGGWRYGLMSWEREGVWRCGVWSMLWGFQVEELLRKEVIT